MKTYNDPRNSGTYVLPCLPQSMARALHALELEGVVEAKLAALRLPLFMVLLAERPDVDGLGFTIDIHPGSPQRLVFPQRLPGARVGKMSLAFPAGALDGANRHAGVLDAGGRLHASGVILPTGKPCVYRLPSVKVYASLPTG